MQKLGHEPYSFTFPDLSKPENSFSPKPQSRSLTSHSRKRHSTCKMSSFREMSEGLDSVPTTLICFSYLGALICIHTFA